ncbi:MAG: tRNA (N(6)-L-threonylcarbamoyladenosine(37)-C(2))-methylthiotransferase MtaB [Anaerolineae bacterium]
MRVLFTNLGCKLNQAELEQLAREFVAAGHNVTNSFEDADLHVINSCTVTHVAARTSRKVARRGRRVNPRLKTVLTGCYATGTPVEAAKLAGVDLVVTNDEKDRLLDIVHHHLIGRPPADSEPQLPIPYVPLEFGNTRTPVKVQDGCNMRCAFCIIPFTRGPERSRAVDEVVKEVQELVAGGFQEIVITGVQISSYQSDGHGLYELTAALLERTDAPRLRLTSIAPWEFDERLLTLWTDHRLCRHIHMSLQSGCTETLRRMRRPYTAEMYTGVAEMIREAIPGVAITTDVIVGFPGETADEFQQSLRFVERMDFAKVHVFPYSAREGTEAATLPAHVPHQEKKARVDAMLKIAEASERRFQEHFLARQLDVLWESRQTCTEPFDPSTRLGTGPAQDRHSRSDGLWQGITDNYIRVLTRSSDDLSNTITRTKLVGLVGEEVVGLVISNQSSDSSH